MSRLAAVLIALSLCAAPHARAGELAVTKKNWRTHPRIVEIRALVEATDKAIAANSLKLQEKTVCENFALEAARKAFRDASGRILKLVSEGGSDDATYALQQYYDEAGRLRFARAISGSTNESGVEHQLYFSAEGKLLWKERTATGVGSQWAENWPEGALSKDPLKGWSAPARCD